MQKKNKLISALLLAMCLCSVTMHATENTTIFNEETGVAQQKRKVTGTVNDAFGSVAGASIAIKGTTLGTISDINGNFSIDVADGQTLVVAFLGYVTQEIKITNQTSLQINLSEDTQALDEVVVTALGMKRSEKSLGYAMKELKGDELNTNLLNPVSALQGKVAGLEISGSDGGMFGSSKIQIRGVSTLGKNNQPIYVVDGVILSNDIKEGNPDWAGNPDDFGNELKNLNPSDFETVSVLKGAAATALYGSRGLNGAVVITTKSGKTNQGLGIQFTQTVGIDAVTSAPDLQNVFGNGTASGYVEYGDKDANGDYYIFDNHRQFSYNNDGRVSLLPLQGMSFGTPFDGREIEYYDGTYRAYSPQKNNFKDAYNKGFNSNTNIAINGGNDKTTFYTSMGFRYASGTLPNNEFKRFSFLGKASHKITDRVKLDISMSFANSMPKNPQINIGEQFVNGNWGREYDPSYSKKLYKGAHGGLASNSYGDQYGNMPGRGIWWRLYENTYEQKETSVRPVVKLEVDLLDWLKFNTEGSYNYYYTRYEGKELGQGYANTGNTESAAGKYEMKLNTKEQTNLNVNFLANKTFGDWAVNGFVRGEYYENFRQYQQISTKDGLVVPGQYFIENSQKTPNYEAKIKDRKRMFSVAFMAGVSWRDQVFVDVTGRNDWSSSLVYSDSHGTYSYFYPSVNGSWLLTNTFRDELPTWVSFAKVRASWAQVGNDTDPYSINSAYKLTTSTSSASNYYGLELPTTVASANLKPERKNAWEVGLDWRFVDNRFGIDFTYYKENTKDQIMTIDVPYQSGIKKQIINAGNIQNKGVEIAATVVPVRTKDWEWDINMTYTKNQNKVISLHENVADYIVLSGDVAYGNYRIGSVAKVGSSYGTLMTDSYLKFDKSSGLPILVWTESMRRANYLRNEAEIYEIGSMVPDFLGSVSTNLKYKNFSLYVGLDMRFGGYVASYNSRYGTAYGYTKKSLDGTPGHGGVSWTSGYDGLTYHDGVVPSGLFPTGTTITQPNGSVYTVQSGGVSKEGESYQELIDKGVIEPTHASAWNYRNNAWTMAGRNYGVVSDAWVKKLNYIALRDVSLSYRVPTAFCQKLKAKSLNLTLAGHNLGYLLNSMPNGENPESVAGTASGEFRVRSFQGVTSSYTFTLNVGF
ncbi:iron complex outermembrane receptor protein [Parabacteroides sp. PF5-5]|uniref:SusC/RagA family TonB-linked outer membrane protein n=1 Tax=unclassified Parabacteroides TaxID=2649774 RepID=UPI0024770E25|nr:MULTISPECIES: SusC/RagA family TonB-linked outer membrane protein [unclassified Parabacteroides]MDH6303516.1 iron complex outermembrane receptor protein [Parabacteroides sp. PH5-39]MDH6314838.1 iron complex outermembrane receptor protein [Parabacteroides sp. PF5-13]MDH6318175.1 iron complex outermembrane receptor protein [Parabacteroides sp. PH5-13]MDH6321893.1 iron complex outermembrane receptor protein [Parabacteroides sp. PH5-8]MDH6326017.1 iron complex outermembrane receptor protein [Pa